MRKASVRFAHRVDFVPDGFRQDSRLCACAQNEIYVCLADYIHQRKQPVKDVAFGGFAILDRLLFDEKL